MADIVKKGQRENLPTQTQGRRGWDPWHRMRELLEWDPFGEMTRAWPYEGRMEGWNPSFEVRETGDAFIFRAEVPGVKQEDIDVNITGNRLTISGKREAEQRDERDRYYVYESSYGTFQRSFTLPEGINPDDVKADLRDGILSLHVPKKAEAQPRKIQIGSGAAPKTKA